MCSTFAGTEHWHLGLCMKGHLMTTSNDTITHQDIQNAVIRLNDLMEEAVPKVQLFFEALVWGIRSLIEEAEHSRQARNVPALPLIVDHVEQPEIEELRQKVQKLERQLELNQYADQDWFST